jgi:hypothetical protein
MSSKLEFQGLWWLPENEEFKMHGTLIFSTNDGMILTLRKTLDNPIYGFGTNFSEIYTTLLGHVNGGQYITLYNCRLFRVVNSRDYYISANLGFINIHFTELETTYFKKIVVGYSYLHEWVGSKIQAGTSASNGKKSFSVNYTEPDDVVATVTAGNNVEGSIKICRYINESMTSNYMEIKERCHCSYELKEAKSFDYFESEFVKPFQNFLSFALNKISFPTFMYLILPDDTDGVKPPILPIQVLFKRNSLSESFEEENSSNFIFRYRNFIEPNTVFLLKDLKDTFENSINGWFNASEKFNVNLGAYFGSLYKDYYDVQSDYLNIINLLENIHQKRYQRQNKIATSEFNNRKKYVLELIPDDCEFKEWFSEKIGQISNAPSLSTRLKELIHEEGFIQSWLICDSIEFEFVKSIVHYRNAIAHATEHVVRDEELYYPITVLRFLLQSYLIREIKIGEDDANNLFLRNEKFINESRGFLNLKASLILQGIIEITFNQKNWTVNALRIAGVL